MRLPPMEEASLTRFRNTPAYLSAGYWCHLNTFAPVSVGADLRGRNDHADALKFEHIGRKKDAGNYL